MSMRNHKLDSSIAKDRDYVLCESRAFFGDGREFLKMLKERVSHPQVRLIVSRLVDAFEKYDTKPFHALHEESRTLAWHLMKTSYQSETNMLLMLTSMLSHFLNAQAKEPGEYDSKIRPR